MINYFEILEIKPKASQGEIFAAYQIKSKEFNGSTIQPLIDEAYNCLKDENTRVIYSKVIEVADLKSLFDDSAELRKKNQSQAKKIEKLTYKLSRKPTTVYRDRSSDIIHNLWQGLKIPLVIFIVLVIIGQIAS